MAFQPNSAPPPMRIEGKVALITGASAGIGAACAAEFARAGARLSLTARSQEGLEAAGGRDALVTPGDLTDEAQANAVVDQVVAKFGKLHILVNNAGALVGTALTENCSLELWNKTLAVNLTSAFLVTRRAIPALKKSPGASVVNIASLSMQSGGTGGAGAYAVAKGGLYIFTRTLARELGPTVRVNAICPGVIETQHHVGRTTTEQLETYRQATPLKRNGTAEEVANTVVYLASDASSFTTGSIIDVGGGRYMR